MWPKFSKVERIFISRLGAGSCKRDEILKGTLFSCKALEKE